MAQLGWGATADGRLIEGDGVVVRSELLGQPFNLGPTNQEYLATIVARVAAYRSENGMAEEALVPVDVVTASGAGLGPRSRYATPASRRHEWRVSGGWTSPMSSLRSMNTRHATLGDPR